MEMPIKPADVIAASAMMEGVLDSALVTLLDMRRASADEMFALIAAYNTGQRLSLLQALLQREQDRDHEEDERRISDARAVFKARNVMAHWMSSGWDEVDRKFVGTTRYRGKLAEKTYSFDEVSNLNGRAISVTQWLGRVVVHYPSTDDGIPVRG